MPGVATWKMLLFNMLPFTPEMLRVLTLPDAGFTVVLIFILLQGWTLALIMALYVLAPIVFMPWLYRALAVLSVVGLYHAYINEGAYQGYLIIALPYFMAGGIAYDVYERYWMRMGLASFTMKLTLVCGAMLLLFMFAHYLGLARMMGLVAANMLCVIIGWLLLPGLFHLTRNNRYDIYVSNLSYTLYLSHFLVFFAFMSAEAAGSLKYWLLLPCCIVMAVLLHEVIEKPVRYYRNKVR